ncbi:MAG: helix-hairpin-helix domain-containing protein [Bacteroidaceae bacterium]|nr:helix-hairpin-helix domain-containing protein [Bacteroidaceae bacterium]
MAHWFDEFRYFSPSEKRGIVLLLGLILVAIVLVILGPFGTSASPVDAEAERLQQEEYEAFMASVREVDSLRRQPRTYERSYEPRTYYTNRSDYPRRSESYRQRFETSDSVLSKEPQLYIPDSTRRYPQKLDEIVVFDLNRVDSLTLMQIPGIGSGIAGMIISYRRQLGGYYAISQLAEINLDYQQLLPWFEVHEEDITRIPVNRSSVERLRSHPYLNFYQARAIVEYRQRHGSVPNLRIFALYDEFTEEDLERLSHYLSFE